MSAADSAAIVAAAAALITALTSLGVAIFVIFGHRKLLEVDRKLDQIIPPTNKENGKQHT